MMGFSGSHTANMTHDPTEYHRNKALGNTWHVPTATWLLFILLLNTLATPATAVRYTPIQRATAIWLATPVHFGPPPRPTPHLYTPQFSWQDHSRWARTLDNSHTPKALDPSLVWCVKTATAFHPITEFRRQAVEEIRQLVEDMEDVTDTWRSQLPPHVHRLHHRGGHHSGSCVYTPAQANTIPPSRPDILEHELTQGFRLMGDLQPGMNWYIRTDQKYLQPKSTQQFTDHNQQYIHRKLTKPRVDDHFEFMLEEIVQEVRAGRMNGPYRQPPSWPTETITPSGYDLDLLPLPHTNPKVAMAFSIKQTGSDGKDRYAVERIGAAAATIPPALCMTSLSTIHQITSPRWPCRHTKRTPQQTCTFGDTTMTEHTGSSPWITPKTHMCCYTRHRDPHYGATTSCSSGPQPASGGTTASVTPWSPFPGSSSCAPPCTTLTTMEAPKSPDTHHRALKLSKISTVRWAIG